MNSHWDDKQRKQPMQGQVNRNCMPCARNNKQSSLTKARILNWGHNTISKGKEQEWEGRCFKTANPPNPLWEALCVKKGGRCVTQVNYTERQID